jgi:hypothetical protein
MHQQHGNVLFIILIAIALFAALSYAVTQSSRDAGSKSTFNTASVKVSQSISFITNVRNAIVKLRILNGCDYTEISFEGTSDPSDSYWYYNPNSPLDNSCHVFHPNGGGMTYVLPAKGTKADGGTSAWEFGSRSNVPGFSQPQITAFIPNVSEDFCKEINKTYLGSNTVINSSMHVGKPHTWRGVASGSHNYNSLFNGHDVGCADTGSSSDNLSVYFLLYSSTL